jgi:hypothetical protein
MASYHADQLLAAEPGKPEPEPVDEHAREHLPALQTGVITDPTLRTEGLCLLAGFYTPAARGGRTSVLGALTRGQRGRSGQGPDCRCLCF